MTPPSSSVLAMPASSVSPSGNNGPDTLTGRPPMWTKSAQRKMARLYVYTTLPLETILRLVHAHRPDPAPGLDSANKKLSSLLDKEPRWLHPRSEADMGRRVTQLSRSFTRLTFAAEAAFDHPSSTCNDSAARVKPEAGQDRRVSDAAATHVQNSLRGLRSGCPLSGRFSAGAAPGFRADAGPSSAQSSVDGGDLASFLRQTTCLSSSSDRTTRSFRQMLPDYSEAYIRTVKRLVKRFTAPIAGRSSISVSPLSGCATPLRTWLDDNDGPPPFNREPHPLPGDFLGLDIFNWRQLYHAPPDVHCHCHGPCPCYNGLDNFTSPWVAADGITPAARRLLDTGPTRLDVVDSDSFGNTVLHFLAARGSMKLLLQVLQTDICNPILNVKNTGGQTFLHVINHRDIQDTELLFCLLRVLSAKGFNMYALDIYGRNFCHILRLEASCSSAVWRICQHYEAGRYDKRDAFGIMAAVGQETRCDNQPESMDLDPAPSAPRPSFRPISSTDPDPAAIAKEARLLKTVRLARENPLLEDANGGNGLHCLAMATLSCGSMVQKYHLDQSVHVQERSSRKPPKSDRFLDSCIARLELRFSLAMGLVEAGVDPNHYDLRGNTPLMAFAAELPEDDDYKTGPKMIELLIRHGADVRARNRAGETALHIAVRCGRKLALKALVQHGASVHVRDAAGRSLLDVADIKMMSSRDEDPREYAHYEACRAWLSSSQGLAVQEPTLLDEWGAAP